MFNRSCLGCESLSERLRDMESQRDEGREQLSEALKQLQNWKWVPEILAGQKFNSPLEAKNYLRDEFIRMQKQRKLNEQK